MRSRKGLPKLLIIGLLIFLLAVMGLKKFSVVNRGIVLLSKYRALLPYMQAQASHETNNFTSKVYLTDHNLYGMKWINGRRGQMATKGLMSPEGDNYAHYLVDSVSIIDLLLWFDYKNFPVAVSDTSQYAKELKERNYYGADLSVYASALNRWINKV